MNTKYLTIIQKKFTTLTYLLLIQSPKNTIKLAITIIIKIQRIKTLDIMKYKLAVYNYHINQEYYF